MANGQAHSNGLYDRHDALTSWVLANGGHIEPNIEIAYNEHEGYYVRVMKGEVVTPRTRVSSCPMRCTLSVMNALNAAPFSDRGTRFPQKFLDANIECPELVQTFFLMEQYVLGEQSWWSAYIRTLPTVEDINKLQFDSDEDAKFISGTNLETGYRELMSKWRGYYDEGVTELKTHDWSHDKCKSYTWELFRWAANIFGSRGFSSSVLSATTPAEEGTRKDSVLRQLFSDKFAVLLPLMDIHNHKPRTKVDWQARTGYVGLQVHDSYTEGQQIYNNYGPKDNESLLLSYGFVSEDKSFQHVALSIQTPPGTLLDFTRKWLIDPRSNIEHKLYILNFEHFKISSATCLEATLLDYDLLDTISVLVANERETSAMMMSQQTLMGTSLAKQHAFDDFRNLLAVFGQILMHCEQGWTRLISTRPEQEPTDSKQANANRLREQQIGHYEDALLLCKLILAQACQPKSESSTSAYLIPYFGKALGPESAMHVTTLLKRFKKITKHEELFSVSHLLDMLPTPTKPTVAGVIVSLAKSIRGFAAADETGLATVLAQARLAIFLSAAQHAYAQGDQIAKRLAAWLEHITAWYPPDDPNWSFVPTDGPWAPGEEPPKALQYLLRAAKGLVEEGVNDEVLLGNDGVIGNGNVMDAVKQWLKPKALCWAYNVMYEETVQVPREVARMGVVGTGGGLGDLEGRESGESDDGKGGGGMDVLLYMQA